MSLAHVGCSGFSYPHWRGRFYPEGLAQRRWFDYYCTRLSCVELNVTFYRLVKPEVFDRWRERTPAGFVFAVKGSRFITHVRMLTEPEEPLGRFFSGVSCLGEKLFAVLWQLPPGFARDVERLARFLAPLGRYPVRNAIEFRHESWLDVEVESLCRAHNVALCIADWPAFAADLPLTADFVYMRRHGLHGRYDSCYTPDELAGDARRIDGYLAGGRDVGIFFNNDFNGYAPENALELSRLLERREGTPSARSG